MRLDAHAAIAWAQLYVLSPALQQLAVASVGILGTLLGKAAVLAWIGRAILKSFDEENKLNTAIAVLTGGVVILLLYVVPVLGFLIYNILGLLALGVVVYTLLLAARARRRSSPPPSIGARPSCSARVRS